MRSERRHELQQNALADWLVDSLRAVKPYQNLVLAVLLAATLVFAGSVWWSRQSGAQATAAWDSFFAAMATGDPADLKKVADDFAGTNVADWSNVVRGDFRLAMGCDQLFKSRVLAEQDLRKAVNNYLAVLHESDEPELRQRATFGLTRAHEAQGDLEKATQSYEDLVKHWPEGMYCAVAQRRLEDLSRPATKRFYDRFAQFDPKPVLVDEPGTPGERPDFNLDSLPEVKPSDDTSLFLPSLDLGESADAGADVAGDSVPAPAESEPGEAATPADDSPAETKEPAEESAEPKDQPDAAKP